MNTAIIILGSPNDKDGNLLPIAISRCEKALSEYHRLADCKILCTGGFGEQFNASQFSHGSYLRDYLVSRGVPASKFLNVALSSFTLEDATLSKPILEEHAIEQVTLVTSDFHMARARLVFEHVMPNITFSYAEAETNVGSLEFEKLVQHEQYAIRREITNINNNST